MVDTARAKRRLKILKLDLNRLKEQIASSTRNEVSDFQNVCVLEAARIDFCNFKTRFETQTNELIELFDENDSNFNSLVAYYMNDLAEVSDVAFQNESAAKAFHRKLNQSDRRESLIPNNVTLNNSFQNTSA